MDIVNHILTNVQNRILSIWKCNSKTFCGASPRKIFFVPPPPNHKSVPILAFWIGTVLLHLSTSAINVSLIPYRSVPIRDSVFCGARSVTNCSGIVWSGQFVMWTGGSIPFRNRYGHTRFRTAIQTVLEQFVPARYRFKYGQGRLLLIYCTTLKANFVLKTITFIWKRI